MYGEKKYTIHRFKNVPTEKLRHNNIMTWVFKKQNILLLFYDNNIIYGS